MNNTMSIPAMILTTALLSLCLACGDSTGPKTYEIDGTYLMRTVNGQELPFTEEWSEECTLRIDGGSLALTGDQWEMVYNTGMICGESSTDFSTTDRGTFSRTGNSILLHDEDGDPLDYLEFTWDGKDRITMFDVDFDYTYVYRR